MAQAVWNGQTIAESDDIAHVEGNAYFPTSAVAPGVLRESQENDTFCHWKGFARYLDVVVGDEVNEGAAWKYDEPYDQAARIKDRVAFWNGIEIIDGPEGRGFVEPMPSLRDGKTGWEALCWLIRHSESWTLSATDVTANTDIPEADIEVAWHQDDVQRYATRYKWRLVGGGGVPITLEKTGPNPS